MNGILVKLAMPIVLVVFGISCASTEKTYRVEITDDSDRAQKQETIDTYEKFPYIDFRSSRL